MPWRISRSWAGWRAARTLAPVIAIVPSQSLRSSPSAWPEATIVFAVFLVAQVLDGLLTYIGVSLLGVEVEANLLLAKSMAAVGTPVTLVAAKLFACACGYVLYRTAWYRPLAITAGLYVGVAVVPWLGLLAWIVSVG
jgi:hypothetical protein